MTVTEALWQGTVRAVEDAEDAWKREEERAARARGAEDLREPWQWFALLRRHHPSLGHSLFSSAVASAPRTPATPEMVSGGER